MTSDPPLARRKKQPVRRKKIPNATSRNVFEVARLLSLEAEQQNVLERYENGAVKKRLVPTIADHLTLYPNPRLGVIVVECSPKIAALAVLQPFVPNAEGKVRQLRYRGYEVQLVVRKD